LTQKFTAIMIDSDVLTTPILIVEEVTEGAAVQAFCKGLSWEECEHECKSLCVECNHCVS